MIKISINKTNDLVDEITISGHSGYDELGHDIVCASVSCISITTVNAILRLDEKSLKYEEKDGYLYIKFYKHDKYIDTLIENMIDLLSNLKNQYSKYIKIQ